MCINIQNPTKEISGLDKIKPSFTQFSFALPIQVSTFCISCNIAQALKKTQIRKNKITWGYVEAGSLNLKKKPKNRKTTHNKK